MNFHFPFSVFNRKQLRKLIVNNGGRVLEKFPGEKEKIPSSVIVISDRYCRTMTYLSALCYGYDRLNVSIYLTKRLI